MLDDPRLNFAISTRGGQIGVDHLGIQVDSADELAAMQTHAAAEMALAETGETTCCYARSEKYWVTDPQGIAWEHFHALANVPVFGQPAGATAAAVRGACCAPAAGTSTGAVQLDRAPAAAPTAGCC